jgi:alpha-amylase
MKKTLLLISYLIVIILPLSSQDFMMQGWYWDYPKKDCNGETNSWASVLQGNVNSISDGGFTYVWLPPPTNASFGQCSNGYDPRDLYDLGDAAPTGLGTRVELDNLINALNNANIGPVADVIYNHRDGGAAETNNAVKDYITVHYNTSKNPFPSDRYRCVLPLGGASGNGAGDYYIKVSSKTGDAQFDNYAYKIYTNTDVVGWAGLVDTMEMEPNGGGDCGTGGNATVLTLGRNFNANVDYDPDPMVCNVDEFKITINPGDFNAGGDNLYIYLNNNGGYSDHRIYGIWNTGANADVVGQLEYQTYTDFSAMPSGQGSMNLENFRPNSSTTTFEQLDGDWNSMSFFYDYDQSQVATQNTLTDWTKWLWNSVDFRGFRMDAVKHFDYAFVGNLLDNLHYSGIDPGMVVGEFFDGDPGTLNTWVSNVENNMDPATKSAIKVRAFDFALRQKLKDVCDNGHDARDIFDSGMVASGANGYNVVTFLNNHDLRESFQPVWNDPILAYAYLLTNNQIGLPCVFYAEYFGVQPNSDYPPGVNIKAEIDELIDLHKTHIYQSSKMIGLNRHGSTYNQFFNSGSADKLMVFQLAAGASGKENIVAINFGSSAVDMWMGVDFDIDGDNTDNFGVDQTFTEVTNNYSNNTTLTVFAPNNDVNIKLPAKSYAMWVQDEVLPVDLLSFEAKAKNTSVLLNWKTANKINLDRFEIERSIDGEVFEKIGSVKTTNSNGYQFLDKTAPLNTTLLYRLRMIDFDEKFDYSKVKSIRLESAIDNMAIIPNPVDDLFRLRFTASQQLTTSIEVSNVLGKIIHRKEIMTQEGLNDFSFDLSSFPQGVYFLNIEIGNDRWMKKVVKR